METRTYKAGSLILPQSKKSPVNEEYTIFFNLYSQGHKVIKREQGEGSLSNLKALCLNLSKFKSTEFRSKVVESFYSQNEKIKNQKQNQSYSETYYNPPESIDEEPEGVYIIYQGSCDIINKNKGDIFSCKIASKLETSLVNQRY